MASIRQDLHPKVLPDFCNLGVWVRVLLTLTLASFAGSVLVADGMDGLATTFAMASAVVLPVVLATLVSLCAGRRWLVRLPYELGALLAVVLAVAYTVALRAAAIALFPELPALPFSRSVFFSALATTGLLYYLYLRGRALSPALTEARLQALQARIRPHFLFNSLNAVLGMIRSDPRRAEAALEDLADLFRSLMADASQLTTLGEEVSLARRYLDIEQLRLGERLQVEWHVENMPADAAVPPMMLQPLVENAVYHGVEPAIEPGVVGISVYRSRDEVHLVVRNPFRMSTAGHHAGNRIAMDNIRERLSLIFDAEASLNTQVSNNAYQVHIVMPYRTLVR